MVNRNPTNTARNSEHHAQDHNSQRRTVSAKQVYVDDVITSLANAHENRRARQVTEWQRVAAQTFRASA